MTSLKSKWLASVAATALGMASVVAQAEAEMYPFILGSTGSGAVADKVADVKKSLQDNGFEIAGDYSPYATAHIIVVTNDALKKAAGTHDRAGYVAAQRVSITKVGDQVQISYTNPPYMAAAYQVDTNTVASVSASLKTALGAIKEYGPAKGKTADDLNSYHYTFGMEYFDEPYDLASYSNHKDATAAVEKGLAKGAGGTKKIYRIDIPGTKQTLFGVGLASGEKGNKYMDDSYIMTEIDFKETRSTAHLPYEVLVNGGDVEALHARFRIAMNFPDLSMMGSNSFMNIMPAPDAIKEALTKAAGGELDSDF